MKILENERVKRNKGTRWSLPQNLCGAISVALRNSLPLQVFFSIIFLNKTELDLGKRGICLDVAAVYDYLTAACASEG